MEQERGVTITAKTLTTFITVCTVLGILFAGVSRVNSYDYRLASLETNKIEMENSISGLIKEIKDLNGKIVDLTIALNRVDARQNIRRNNEAQ